MSSYLSSIIVKRLSIHSITCKKLNSLEHITACIPPSVQKIDVTYIGDDDGIITTTGVNRVTSLNFYADNSFSAILAFTSLQILHFKTFNYSYNTMIDIFNGLVNLRQICIELPYM